MKTALPCSRFCQCLLPALMIASCSGSSNPATDEGGISDTTTADSNVDEGAPPSDSSVPTDTAGDTNAQDPATTDESAPDDAGADSVQDSADDPGPGNQHCCWPGVTWDGLWPDDSKVAVYTVKTFGQEEKDLPARIDYTPVSFKGADFSRFIVGTPQPGNDGMVIYFDNSVPWVPKSKGAETFSPSVATGTSQVEWFDDVWSIDLNKPTGSSDSPSFQVNADFGGTPASFTYTYSWEIASLNESVETPMGTVDGCMHIHIDMTDGDFSFEVEVYVHPEHFLVGMTNAPSFTEMWIKSPWASM